MPVSKKTSEIYICNLFLIVRKCVKYHKKTTKIGVCEPVHSCRK